MLAAFRKRANTPAQHGHIPLTRPEFDELVHHNDDLAEQLTTAINQLDEARAAMQDHWKRAEKFKAKAAEARAAVEEAAKIVERWNIDDDGAEIAAEIRALNIKPAAPSGEGE